MNTERFRGRMIKAAKKDIMERQRRLELLRNVDARIVRAAARAFETPDAAADWLMTAPVSIGEMTPLDMASSRSGRAAVMKILSRISRGTF